MVVILSRLQWVNALEFRCAPITACCDVLCVLLDFQPPSPELLAAINSPKFSGTESAVSEISTFHADHCINGLTHCGLATP